MKVQARFFALYRERVGQSTVDFDLADGATVADLVASVMHAYPHLSPDPARMVLAINREYADHNKPLRDGDEAAFIPPVSGGV